MEGAGYVGVADCADEDGNVMSAVLAGLYQIIHLLLLGFLSLGIFCGENSPDRLGHKLICSLRSERIVRIAVALVSLLTMLDRNWKPISDVLQRGHSCLWSRLRSRQLRQKV